MRSTTPGVQVSEERVVAPALRPHNDTTWRRARNDGAARRPRAARRLDPARHRRVEPAVRLPLAAADLADLASAAGVFYAVTEHVPRPRQRAGPPGLPHRRGPPAPPGVLGHLHILLNYEWD